MTGIAYAIRGVKAENGMPTRTSVFRLHDGDYYFDACGQMRKCEVDLERRVITVNGKVVMTGVVAPQGYTPFQTDS